MTIGPKIIAQQRLIMSSLDPMCFENVPLKKKTVFRLKSDQEQTRSSTFGNIAGFMMPDLLYCSLNLGC